MATRSVPRLTDAQGETLHALFGGGWRFGSFTPREAFPGRDNRDNGMRRCIRTLAGKGLLTIAPESDWTPDGITVVVRYRLNADGQEAYQRWFETRGEGVLG